MAKKDLAAQLVSFYEFQLGTLPRKEAFTEAIRDNVLEDDLRLFFLIPFLGTIREQKLRRKARRAGIAADAFEGIMERLVPRGIVATYVADEGDRLYERAPIIALLEMSVRDPEESSLRSVSAQVMNELIEGKAETIPTKTPYYRVLPVEMTLNEEADYRQIPVDAQVPDPREVLPIDVISQMLRDEPLITVADCYCRMSKQLLGEGCGHPLETCFYFNELGKKQLEAGYAREVGYDEAMQILWDCEEQGLVHNVSNCEGKIQTLCNCCECCCGVLKGWSRGETNTTSPSRFVIALDESACTLQQTCVETCPVEALSVLHDALVIGQDRCVGCGLCIPACPEGALHLELRDHPPRIFADNDALFRKINWEAMLGLVKRRIFGS